MALAACALAVLMHWPLPVHLGRDRCRATSATRSCRPGRSHGAATRSPTSRSTTSRPTPSGRCATASRSRRRWPAMRPPALVGDGVEAAIVRYNLLFLFAYALAFAGAYLLARRAGRGPGGRRGCGSGVRLRALAARAGRPPARALERRHPAVAVPARARLPQPRAGDGAGGLAGGGLAADARLHARPAARLPAAGARPDRGRGLARRRPRQPVPPLVCCLPSAAGVVAVLLAAVLLARPYMRGARRPSRGRAARRPRWRASPGRSSSSSPRRSRTSSGARRRSRSATGSRRCPSRRCSPASRSWRSLSRVSGRVPIRDGCGSGSGSRPLVLAVLSLGFHDHGGGSSIPTAGSTSWRRDGAGSACPGRIMTLTSLALALLAAAGAQRLVDAAASRRAASAGRRSRHCSSPRS